jgi:Tol biopolymer transport system component
VAQGVSGVYRVSWSADGESVRFWTLDGVELTWRAVSRLGGPVRTLDLPKFTGGLSPDGSYAVYASGDSVFKYSIADDTSTLLFIWERVAHSPDLSPDGRRSAFVSGNSAWLYGFNVSASSIWIRVTGDAFMDISPAWLDGDHLLFVSNRDGPREVYVVEVGSTGPRGEPQKVPGIVDPSSISYSVAGGNLAFIKAIVRQNIWSFPIGSAAVSITQGHPVTRENAVIEEHDVSPDGESIAYCSTLRGDMDIYVRPLEGGAAMRITDLPGDEFAPKWSPDGSEIAFYVGPGSLPDGDGAVMVVEADGGTPSLIASGPGWNQDPRWSPSGLEIAFYSGRTGQGEVWLVSREFVGGAWGEATQLTDFGCRPYDWAPDGSGVLCAWGGELRLVSREGEVLWRYRPSVDGLREIGRSAYSRDGSAVYLWGEHEAGSEGIWAIPARGGEPRLVVAFDDLELGGTSMFSVGPDHLYVTAGEYETDVWVADLEVR